MPGANVRQEKLKVMCVAPETTVGTAIAIGSATFRRLPTIAPAMAATEGTRIITRELVADGYAAAAEAAIGSFAMAFSFEVECHDMPASEVPYLVNLLRMCGHNCNGTAGTDYAITPATLPLTAYPGAPVVYTTDLLPGTNTIVLAELDGDAGAVDRYALAAGCVATHTLNIVGAGERILFGFVGAGFIPDGGAQWVNAVDAKSIGSFIPGAGKPVTALSVTATVVGATSGAYDGIELKNFVFTQGAEVRPTTRPQAQYGYSVPSVFLGVNPTVSFQLASTRGDDIKALADWRLGQFLAITVSFSVGNADIELVIPRVQFQDVVMADDAGAKVVQYTGLATRPNGSATVPYTYTVTDTTP
jgi:hypothetical protein